MAKQYAFIAFDPTETQSVGMPAIEREGLSLLCTRITRVSQSFNIYVEDGFGDEFLYMEVHASRIQYAVPVMPAKTYIKLVAPEGDPIGFSFFVVDPETQIATDYVVVDKLATSYLVMNENNLDRVDIDTLSNVMFPAQERQEPQDG